MSKIIKLGNIINLLNGYAFKSKEYSSEGYFLMRITNVKKGYISNHNPRYIKINPNKKLEKFILKDKDILMTLTGDVGRVGMIKKKHLPCVLNQRVAKVVIIDKSIVDKNFLFLFLNSEIFIKKVEKISHGAAQSNVATKDILNITLNLPSLKEQKRIAAKLTEVFTEVDQAIDSTSKLQKNINILLESALNEITKIGSAQITLKDVCYIKSSLVDPKEERYSNLYHIGAANIQSVSNKVFNLLTSREEKLTSGKYQFDEESVLYSKIRPYLRKVHMPNFAGLCSADIYPLTPKSNTLNRNFLFYLLLSKHFTDYAISKSARAGMPKVNQNHLFAYKFCLPSIEAQSDYVKKMDLLFIQIDILRNLYLKKYSNYLSLKTAILLKELKINEAA